MQSRSPILVTSILVLLVWSMAACGPAPEAVTQNDPAKEEWVELFNGTDLDGWTPKIAHYEPGENYGNTFRVVDGAIQVSYDQYTDFNDSFGHLFWKDKYSHYRLVVEYRFTGDWLHDTPGWAYRNSGIMFHSQAPETMLKEQNFPISLEAQFLGGLGEGQRPTMSLCTPGTEAYQNSVILPSHCTTSMSKTYDGDQWVTAEIEVHGHANIKHIVEGETVLAYQTPEIGGAVVDGFDPAMKPDGQPLSGGYFALQSEGSPVEFRRVALLNLTGCMDESAKNYKSYYENNDSAACQF